MIDATIVLEEKFKSIERHKSLRYSIPDIPASTTSDIIRLLNIKKEGKINIIRIGCSSTDYSISLRTMQNVVLPSIDEIFQVTAINQRWDAVNQNILYSNHDNPEQEALYCVITNNDGVNGTGNVDLEIILSEM